MVGAIAIIAPSSHLRLNDKFALINRKPIPLAEPLDRYCLGYSWAQIMI